MSKEANAAALKTFAEAVNTGKFELFEKVVAPDNVDHDPGPKQVAGPSGYRALFTELRTAFPDMKVTPEITVADEDSIAFAYTFTGTQTGPLMGNAPTGKAVTMRGMQISKFKDGLMVERWGSSDQFSMLQQIVRPRFRSNRYAVRERHVGRRLPATHILIKAWQKWASTTRTSRKLKR